MIHVCSLAALPETVRLTGASHVLTIMANVDQVQRPRSVLPANHLKIQVDDITEPIDGFIAPSEVHIEQVLNFVRGWDLCENGAFRLPTGPGLGIDIDPAAIAAHPPQRNPFPSLWDSRWLTQFTREGE